MMTITNFYRPNRAFLDAISLVAYCFFCSHIRYYCQSLAQQTVTIHVYKTDLNYWKHLCRKLPIGGRPMKWLFSVIFSIILSIRRCVNYDHGSDQWSAVKPKSPPIIAGELHFFKMMLTLCFCCPVFGWIDLWARRKKSKHEKY